MKVKDKTGLLVTTAEGWPEVVKLLLDFKANVNEQVLHVYTFSIVHL